MMEAARRENQTVEKRPQKMKEVASRKITPLPSTATVKKTVTT